MEKQKLAIALGFFDGVHLGHAALLNMVKKRAQEQKLEPAVLTFDVHPDTLVFGKNMPLINSASEREEIIRRLFGIERTIFLHFNHTLMRMPWEEFICSLTEELSIAAIVVGHDFSFGYKGQGTAERLNNWCKEHGISCDIIPPVCLDGKIISSTLIRSLLVEGNMEEANRMLGHPHFLSDVIHSGYHLGTKLGSPTINMGFPESVLIPKYGVYATKVILDDQSEHIAVTNIGVRPTVSDGKQVTVESHLLDFDGKLYGKQARVDFYHFQREEVRFSSPELLATQIKKDAEKTRAWFQNQL